MVFRKAFGDESYMNPDSPPESDFSATPLSNWFTPIKSTKSCSCCATQRKYGSFPKIPDSIFGFIDPDGNSRSLICNRCLQEVVDHFTAEDPEHNQYKSLYRICALTNLYYSDEIAHKVIEEERTYEDGSPVAPWLTWTILYFRAIMDHPIYSKRKFYESDNFLFNQVIDAQGKLSEIDKLPEQTKKNRASIITTYHRDPFENDPLEDRIQMYEDLLTMTTADVGENLPKSRAIIEIRRHILCFIVSVHRNVFEKLPIEMLEIPKAHTPKRTIV